MRRNLSVLSLVLLVAAVALIALTGCSRQAQVREEQPSDQMSTEQTPTAAAEAEQGGENVAPLPGETVVSALTPAQATDTPVPVDQAQPTETEPAPTAEPAAPTEPAVPTEAASPTAAEAAAAADTKDTDTGGEGQTVVHKVEKGETLSGIAEQYGTTTAAIVAANGLTDASNIIPGQMLEIQASGDSAAESSGNGDGDAPVCRKKHKVKKGEWVFKIARKYDVPPKQIMKANDLTSRKARNLQPGTVLCIP
jgi:LysM repeat protein